MSEGSPLVTMQNIIVTMPYSLYISGLLATLYTANPSGALLTSVFVVNELLNHLLKFLVKKLVKGAEFAKRPLICDGNKCARGCGGPPQTICGASRKKICQGCGIFYKGKPSTSQGMPSGHSQTLAGAAMFFTLYKYANDKTRDASFYSQISISWLLAIIVMIQRSPLVSGCHSYLQIVAGAIVGMVYAFGAYVFCSSSAPDHFPRLDLN